MLLQKLIKSVDYSNTLYKHYFMYKILRRGMDHQEGRRKTDNGRDEIYETDCRMLAA
jgi:SPX domain protein involved in polyphosphate accumulation